MKEKHKWFEGDLARWRNFPTQYPGRSEREFQKSKVYASERTVWSTGKFAERFSSISEVQGFVNTILMRAWFQKRFPGTREVSVIQKCRGWAYGSCHNDRISIPIDPSLPIDKQWALNKALVLHELAHVCTPPITGGSHGRFFARTYLSLVRHVLGIEEYKQLRAAFKQAGVKYSPKMRLSDEERKRRRDVFKKRFDIGDRKPKTLLGMTTKENNELLEEVMAIDKNLR